MKGRDILRGITFPNQRVSAIDHGALFAKCLSDGIISGCTISFPSARSVRIEKGYMIIAGREINIDSPITLTIPGSDNYPYVRLKVTIDTAGTSTRESFNQVSFSFDYSNTSSGFPSLIQQNINSGNASDSIYQATIILFRMSNGAITESISRIQSSAPASGAKAVSVTIPVSAWSNRSATVTVNGVTAYTSHSHPIVSPAPASVNNWVQCGIVAVSQSLNTITFSCTTTPSSEVTANVLIIYT